MTKQNELDQMLTQKQLDAKEKCRLRSQESYTNNREQIKQRSKERYDGNRLVILERQKRYNREHADEYKEYGKKYYLKNKDKFVKNYEKKGSPPRVKPDAPPVNFTCEICNKELKTANKKIHEISNAHLRNKLKHEKEKEETI